MAKKIKYIDNDVIFNDVKEPGIALPSVPISRNNNYTYNGAEDQITGIQFKTINSIDIDWNEAEVEEDIKISTTGQFINWINQKFRSIPETPTWSTLSGKPNFATVATSGSYNDLLNKPNLFDGDYNSLTNKPTIPTVPSNVGAFTNDSGYITLSELEGALGNIDLTNNKTVKDYIDNNAVNSSNLTDLENRVGHLESHSVSINENKTKYLCIGDTDSIYINNSNNIHSIEPSKLGYLTVTNGANGIIYVQAISTGEVDLTIKCIGYDDNKDTYLMKIHYEIFSNPEISDHSGISRELSTGVSDEINATLPISDVKCSNTKVILASLEDGKVVVTGGSKGRALVELSFFGNNPKKLYVEYNVGITTRIVGLSSRTVEQGTTDTIELECEDNVFIESIQITNSRFSGTVSFDNNATRTNHILNILYTPPTYTRGKTYLIIETRSGDGTRLTLLIYYTITYVNGGDGFEVHLNPGPSDNIQYYYIAYVGMEEDRYYLQLNDNILGYISYNADHENCLRLYKKDGIDDKLFIEPLNVMERSTLRITCYGEVLGKNMDHDVYIRIEEPPTRVLDPSNSSIGTALSRELIIGNSDTIGLSLLNGETISSVTVNNNGTNVNTVNNNRVATVANILSATNNNDGTISITTNGANYNSVYNTSADVIITTSKSNTFTVHYTLLKRARYTQSGFILYYSDPNDLELYNPYDNTNPKFKWDDSNPALFGTATTNHPGVFDVIVDLGIVEGTKVGEGSAHIHMYSWSNGNYYIPGDIYRPVTTLSTYGVIGEKNRTLNIYEVDEISVTGVDGGRITSVSVSDPEKMWVECPPFDSDSYGGSARNSILLKAVSPTSGSERITITLNNDPNSIISYEITNNATTTNLLEGDRLGHHRLIPSENTLYKVAEKVNGNYPTGYYILNYTVDIANIELWYPIIHYDSSSSQIKLVVKDRKINTMLLNASPHYAVWDNGGIYASYKEFESGSRNSNIARLAAAALGVNNYTFGGTINYNNAVSVVGYLDIP